MDYIRKPNVVVVGGGSSAHVLISILDEERFSVSLLTRKPANWTKEVNSEYHNSRSELKGVFKGRLENISDNPADLIPQADYIILCLPVHQYRSVLHNIAPHISKDKEVFVGTIYGQGGFNWMVEEIADKYNLTTIVKFAVGLIPWICRTIEYGKLGVTYGPKKINVVAVNPRDRFDHLNDNLLHYLCQEPFGTGAFKLAENFISLTLSVDNQIIHPSRCYGLHKASGGSWDSEEQVPFFYRDYDDLSANLLKGVDDDFSVVRKALIKAYPEMNFEYMLDYLALERFSYQSENEDIKESFVNSETLGAIKTPVVQEDNGKWVLNKRNRFFTDDLHYGLSIVKWFAQELELELPTVDSILNWASELLDEPFQKDGRLIVPDADEKNIFKSGIPSVYGFKSIDDIMKFEAKM